MGLDLPRYHILPGGILHVYIPGVTFVTQEILAQRKAEHEDIKVEYVYEVGSPLLFDSRTLHSVGNNHSSEWRVLIWFIFDCY